MVVTNDSRSVGIGSSVEDGLRILRLPCYPLLDGRLPLAKKDSDFNFLMDELSHEHWDGVLVNTRLFQLSLIGLDFARSQGAKAVVLDHGSAYLSFGQPILDILVRRYEDAITARVKSYAPVFFGVSSKSVEWLRHFEISAKGVLSNSIHAEEYRDKASARDFRRELGIATDAFMIAFLGRLIPEKGINSLIEASRSEELRERGAVFVLAGDGPLADEVRVSAGPYLQWVGRCSSEDASALLQQADVLCLPTRSEGFSTVLLEASACGTPSIVTDVGGARELIPDGDYGTIIESMDTGCVIDAVCRLCDDRELLARQSKNSQKLVELDYSWGTTARQVEMAFSA